MLSAGVLIVHATAAGLLNSLCSTGCGLQHARQQMQLAAMQHTEPLPKVLHEDYACSIPTRCSGLQDARPTELPPAAKRANTSSRSPFDPASPAAGASDIPGLAPSPRAEAAAGPTSRPVPAGKRPIADFSVRPSGRRPSADFSPRPSQVLADCLAGRQHAVERAPCHVQWRSLQWRGHHVMCASQLRLPGSACMHTRRHCDACSQPASPCACGHESQQCAQGGDLPPGSPMDIDQGPLQGPSRQFRPAAKPAGGGLLVSCAGGEEKQCQSGRWKVSIVKRALHGAVPELS